MRTYAQWLRGLGLLIEMTGVVGIARERAGTQMPRLSIPGGPTVSWSWVALAIGFVVWLVATIILAATRPGDKWAGPRCSGVDETGPPRNGEGISVNLETGEAARINPETGEAAKASLEDDHEHFGLARDDEKR
jgi:hypothetical protein